MSLLKKSLSTCKVDGHTDRVFAIANHPINAHEFVSSGWDNTLQVSKIKIIIFWSGIVHDFYIYEIIVYNNAMYCFMFSFGTSVVRILFVPYMAFLFVERGYRLIEEERN